MVILTSIWVCVRRIQLPFWEALWWLAASSVSSASTASLLVREGVRCLWTHANMRICIQVPCTCWRVWYMPVEQTLYSAAVPISKSVWYMCIHANMHACRCVLSLELLPRYFCGVWTCNMCVCVYAACVHVCMQQHLLSLELLVSFCCVRVYEGVWGCMRVYEGVWGCMRVCEGVWGCMRVYEGVWCLYMRAYIHICAHTYMCCLFSCYCVTLVVWGGVSRVYAPYLHSSVCNMTPSCVCHDSSMWVT